MRRLSTAGVALGLMTLWISAALAPVARSAAGESLDRMSDRIVFAVPMKTGEILNPELFTIRSDGSDVVQLLDRAFSQRYPSWAPDGRSIAFTNRGSIHVMAPDGRRERVVLPHGFDAYADTYDLYSWPSWSPDGTRLLFVRTRYSNANDSFISSALGIVRLDGSRKREIYQQVDNPLYQPVWSPSGNKIAFFTCDTTRALVGFNHCFAFTMSPDGTEPTNLATATSLWDGYPRWISDDRLILLSNRGCTEDPLETDPCFAAHAVRPDGSDSVQILGPHDWDADGQIDPVWVIEPSPDPGRFVLSIVPASGDAQLWTWDSRSGARKKIFDGPAWAEVDWQPRCTIKGTRGDDQLLGTSGRDLICALGGDDRITGLGGDDVIFGHAGDDVIDGGVGADIVVGNGGRDRCDRDRKDHSRVC